VLYFYICVCFNAILPELFVTGNKMITTTIVVVVYNHRWAQLTKMLTSLTAILIVKTLASLTLIRYFALFY